jgi:hypothetical protein
MTAIFGCGKWNEKANSEPAVNSRLSSHKEIEMNLRTLILLLVIFLCFLACRRDLPALAEEEAAILRCNYDSLNQQSALFLSLGDLEIKLADLTACDPIPASSYAAYQAPDTARSVVFGRQDNEQVLFFLSRSEQTVEVYRSAPTEAIVGPPAFRLFATYRDGKFSFR